MASMQKERNLDIFKTIQKDDGYQVVIVGRETEIADKQLMRELQEAGCLVWIKHFSNIEDIYNLADCYVFPTIQEKACIESPLSVLEAMACNLPVVTTRFGALASIFGEGSGLFFAEHVEHMPRILDAIKNGRPTVETRHMVARYSWDNLTENLVEIYEELLRYDESALQTSTSTPRR